MDILEFMRTLGALAVVLGILSGGLWVVKRYNIALPGRVGAGSHRRLELVERLGLDGKRSAVLLRRDGQEHLIILCPEGNMLVESMAGKPAPEPREDIQAQTDSPDLFDGIEGVPQRGPSFPQMVAQASQRDSDSFGERLTRGLAALIIKLRLWWHKRRQREVLLFPQSRGK